MTDKVEVPSYVYERLADKQIIHAKSRRIAWFIAFITTWFSFLGLFLYGIIFQIEYLWWDIPLGMLLFLFAFGDSK